MPTIDGEGSASEAATAFPCSSRSPIDELPEELLRSVFRLLDHRSLGRCARVCRNWRRLACNRGVWAALAAGSSAVALREAWEARTSSVSPAEAESLATAEPLAAVEPAVRLYQTQCCLRACAR